MFKKLQLVAQIVGTITLAFLAIFGLLTLLRVDAARALGLEPPAPQEAQSRPDNVPQTMNYQGNLRDAAGELLTGAYTMTFRLYAVVADPIEAALWSEVHTGVVVREGVFDVILGDITPLPASLFSASTFRYLGVTVDPFQEMIPRQRLSSVPYAVQAELPDELPPGVVMAWAGETPPPGWLLCDGDAVSSTDYPYLFEAISTTHGNGSTDADPTTDFILPDYRGRFLRGVDDGAGRDPDVLGRSQMNPGGNSQGEVGSVQPDEYKSHQHGYTSYGGRYQVWGAISGDWYWYNDSAQTTTGGGGGNETRPENAYVYWIIKY